MTPVQICLFSVKICFKFVEDLTTEVYFSIKKVIQDSDLGWFIKSTWACGRTDKKSDQNQNALSRSLELTPQLNMKKIDTCNILINHMQYSWL